MNRDSNIILCGFMGVGKSTVGRCLADLMWREWIDTDNVIERNEAMTVKEIFTNQNKGPDYFRECEDLLCNNLSKNKSLVISLGGGAIVNNYSKFSKNSLVVCLTTSFDTLYNRIKNSKRRPLVTNKFDLKELFDKRQEDYKKSHLIIDVGVFEPKQSAEIIKCAFETIK